jgi:hypothetical protein
LPGREILAVLKTLAVKPLAKRWDFCLAAVLRRPEAGRSKGGFKAKVIGFCRVGEKMRIMVNLWDNM